MHVATAQQWISAARPRTLPAAVAPVLVGTGAGIALGGFSWLRGGLALLVSLALQVGVNYSNDYSDGIRGTDADRVGPTRLVGAGLARPSSVKLAAFGCFGVAGLAGLILAALTSWWLIPVGIAAVAAAWFYTGGPKPYGYAGFGEIFVFVFFGLVAVLGTTYVQAGEISLTAAMPTGISHHEVSAARINPARPAIPKQLNAASLTVDGAARPAPTSRVGPTRTVSVPRMPSE